MRLNSIPNNEEKRDRLKSGIITAIIWSALLFFLFWYKVVEKIPPQQEVITKMLINFGDNRNGNGLEEPANQEGSLAAETATTPKEEIVADKVNTKITTPTPVSVAKDKKESATEKIITGNNEKHLVKPNDKKADLKKDNSSKNKKENPVVTNNKNDKKGGSAASTVNAKSRKGDGKGNQAIGNLIAGRGKNPGSHGNGEGIGNSGDPLGGDGNGDSKIGIDRRLIGFIPGTMGRGGAQPTHNCTASGTIVIAYTVDKSGNVVAAKRSSGIADPCAVSTTTAWVKKYVKAEKSSVSSTGNYAISF
jgi:hypothetical protein